MTPISRSGLLRGAAHAVIVAAGLLGLAGAASGQSVVGLDQSPVRFYDPGLRFDPAMVQEHHTTEAGHTQIQSMLRYWHGQDTQSLVIAALGVTERGDGPPLETLDFAPLATEGFATGSVAVKGGIASYALRAEASDRRGQVICLFWNLAAPDGSMRFLGLNCGLGDLVARPGYLPTLLRGMAGGSAFAAEPGANIDAGLAQLADPPTALPKPRVSPAAQRGLPSVDLLDQLEQGTVLVLVQQTDQLSLGSGFFISPTLVVTNAHVVANNTQPNTILTNQRLQRAIRARVIRQTKDVEQGGPDLAVLEIHPDDRSVVAGIKPLSLSDASRKLGSVTAAGFPANIVSHDAGMARLIQGDITAAPDMVVRQGAVSSLSRNPSNVSIVLHTAEISGGNSGGPLIDACGRVIGVNTYTRGASGPQLSYAITAGELIRQLKAWRLSAIEVKTACE